MQYRPKKMAWFLLLGGLLFLFAASTYEGQPLAADAPAQARVVVELLNLLGMLLMAMGAGMLCWSFLRRRA